MLLTSNARQPLHLLPQGLRRDASAYDGGVVSVVRTYDEQLRLAWQTQNSPQQAPTHRVGKYRGGGVAQTAC